MAKTFKVALLFDKSNGYDRAILRGINKYGRIHGPWLIHLWPLLKYVNTSQLKKWGADGIIMRQSLGDERIIKTNVPIIVSPISQKEIKGVGNIIGNSTAIASMAAEHLLNCGFTHFAYCGIADLPWSNLRGENFAKSIGKAGFKTFFYEHPDSKLQRLWENEQKVLAQWVKSLPKPCGILVCNDERAQQVIEACRLAGQRVPNEIAVLGINNDELLCDLSDPPLSSIALNAERAGYEAAEMLNKMMLGHPPENMVITVDPIYVVARESTDILAMEDEDVAGALRFIRTHVKESIGVINVVESLTISRRVLEKRFRQLLGRSIQHEIRRIRVEHIAWMLAETNLSIAQIAFSLGFSGPESLSRYFKTEKGMSPLYYRSQYAKK